MSLPNERQPLMRTPVKGEPLPPPTSWERVKGKVHALVLLLVIFVVFAVSAMAYSHVFERSIPVTMQAGRAGLQMHEGNRVKVNGVDLGRVSDVALRADGSGVDITMALKPDVAGQVPANVTASLEQLTAFGNKAVQMRLPANPSPETLRAGSVIRADHISVEINTTFESLTTLINRIQPSKLNAVLGAFANTLEGNGDLLGADITAANAYLKKFNSDLGPLQRDWRSAGGFANVYADAGDDIADLLRNAGTITDTIGDKRAAFEHVLDELGETGVEIDGFFDENADPVVEMLRSLRPTTTLLDEYSPMLTCFLDGSAVTYDKLAGNLFNESGAIFEINMVEPGSTEMYHYPQDLPENGPGAQKGPNCRGLPVVENNEDSLAGYTTGPPSLVQRTTDNTPRPATQPGQLIPVPASPMSPLSTSFQSRWSAMTPVQKFFGPYPPALGDLLKRKAGN